MRISGSPLAFSCPGLIGMPASNRATPNRLWSVSLASSAAARSRLGSFRLSQAQLSRRSATCHREGQLQLKRCRGMQLAPQSQKGFGHPVAEPARAVQPDMATNAKRDQQGLRVTLVAMMNDEPSAHSANPASEPVTLSPTSPVRGAKKNC
jgi:hypothetical protein